MRGLVGQMDPAIAAPIATLAGAMATAIIMWASYNYPRGYHRRGAEKDEDRETKARRDREDVERANEREDEDTATKRHRLGRDDPQEPVEDELDDSET